MALDFPSSPTIGQVYGAYVWDGEKWVATGTIEGLIDAPSTGQTYGRKNAAWVPVLPAVAVQDANARLDAGVTAALTVAIAIRDSMNAVPDNFTAGNFAAVKIQLDALTQVFAAMLQAQADGG